MTNPFEMIENKIDQLTEAINSMASKMQLTSVESCETPESDHLTVEGAAKVLGLSKQSIYTRNMKGQLPKPKCFGKKLIFSKRALLEFIDNNGKLPESTNSGTSQSIPQKPKRRIVSNVKRVSGRK